MRKYIKYFRQSIESQYPQNHAAILAQMHDKLISIQPDVDFARTSKNPIDRRLDFVSCFLALIKVLDKYGEDYDKIRRISLEITIRYASPTNAFQAFIKKLIPKLAGYKVTNYILKKFDARIRKPFHPHGFAARIVTDKSQTYGFGYGFDILECGICKLFTKHGYYKYASILCEVDKITSAMAGLELIQNGTIANGSEKCDFRFKILSRQDAT